MFQFGTATGSPEPTPPPGLPAGHLVHLPGRGSMFVREAEGPPGAPAVILLHGLGATADLNWHGAFTSLGHHFRVIAPDHRGHGRGIRSRAPFRLTDCADDVLALADALGIERFTAVGYSMGGPVAQLTWRAAPRRVQGLVICASSRDFRWHPRERLLYAGIGAAVAAAHIDVLRLGMRAVDRVLAPVLGLHQHGRWAAEQLRRSDINAVLEAATDLGRFSSREWIGEVDVPTAVVVTARDRLVPARRQRRLADMIPDAAVFEIADGHHAAARSDGPFIDALLGACRAVSPWPSTARRGSNAPDPTRRRRRRLRARRADRERRASHRAAAERLITEGDAAEGAAAAG